MIPPWNVRPQARWAGSVLAVALCTVPAVAQDAGLDAGAAAAPAPSAALVSDPRTAQVRALLAGTLEVGVEPQSLFEVDLHDASAVEIERVRVRALLRAVDASMQPPAPAAPPASPAQTRRGQAAKPPPEPPAEAPSLVVTRADIDALDSEQWRARLELDRARLEVYSLSEESRAALLSKHEARQLAARPRESEDARRAREAEAERQQALESARLARSETERLVSEELARLISLHARVVAAREHLAAQRVDLAARQDAVLGWQRRVRDAKAGAASEADALYDALRQALRVSRDHLDSAIAVLDTEHSEVPALGPDPLAEIPAEIPAAQARERRAVVAGEIRQARADERAARRRRAAALLDEVTTLNQERLGLLAHLSPAKRDAVTGFTAEGWDQAQSEARHLVLVLRYHRHVGMRWLRSIRAGDRSGISVWSVVAVLVPWSLMSLALVWWRRRSVPLLALVERRIAEIERRQGRVIPSFAHRSAHFAQRTHRSLEWLLFFLATLWLLPNSAQQQLEVQLIASIVAWWLGGALIVNAINALAAGASRPFASEQKGAGALRLRSLRLVGRIVVAFGLILVLSSRLVGEGTIHSWVLSTCWMAAVPVYLILVSWWRGTVFERVDRLRKKSRLQLWVLENRTGWQSFLAAMVGALHLFVLGAVKLARNWLSGFYLARRAHAYLFKRELDRLVNGGSQLVPLSPRSAALDVMSPDAAYREWVPCAADDRLAALHGRIGARQGGLVAIVGGRGMGKTSLLRSLSDSQPGAVALSCTQEGTLAAVRSSLGLNEDPSVAAGQVATAPCLMLLDEAHALVRPVIGGLQEFDDLLNFARAHAQRTLWVFAIDDVLWPFLKRARDERPLFDEVVVLAPWTESQIGALLTQRSQQAEIAPSFEGLLERLPPTADEIDRQEALEAKRQGYIRMLWDHARGNPGLALEVWRSSLAQAEDGSVQVRPLQIPDTLEIEKLPDTVLFILRAVLQLAPASVTDVAQATRLTQEQIVSAFRFGEAHGYLEQRDGRVQVTWRWLRSVVRLLERRHLLVNS